MVEAAKILKISGLILTFFTVSCQVTPRKAIVDETAIITQPQQEQANKVEVVKDVGAESHVSFAEEQPGDNTDLMKEILAENAIRDLPSPKSPSKYGKIELPVNKYVKVWINYFTGRGRDHMTRYLSRSSKYIPKMKEILIKEGLPEDLVYLPVIESGFYTRAKSIKGATGYWQFMPGSARDFGLKVNYLVDERQDYVRSTQAAAKYLKRLYTLFGDWKLALSAYNAGENRVKRQLMNAETRDYWTLVRRKSLYKETREYVPKFIAATLIAKNPLLYGFVDVPYQDQEKYHSMYVHRPVNLKTLARKMKVSYKKMRKLNPKYRTHRVPIYKGKASMVRVPLGTLAKAQVAVKKSYTKIAKRVYRPLKISRYKVKRGDNLTKIARKFGVSVRELRRTNGLGKKSVLFVGRSLKIVSRSKAPRRSVSAASRVAKRSHHKLKRTHRVARGESLSKIAKRYNLSLAQVLKFNNMKMGSKLYVGQKIRLAASPKRVSRRGHHKKVVTYKVKAGDNLQKISKRFGTSVQQLKKTNGLRSNKINAEQKLKIVVNNIKTHIVKRGESLIAIANKYKVSMNNILVVNNLQNKSKIQIGHALTIPMN